MELYISLQENIKLGIREAGMEKRTTSGMTLFNKVS